LVFSARAEEAGSLTASIPAHSQDGEGKIAFNIRYLTGYLAGKLGMVLLETSDPKAPGRFFCSGSPDVLLMPVFVQWDGSPTTEPAADQPADEEAPGEPAGGQQAPVDEGTAEEPAAAASPPTRSRKPRRGK
jgi:hypothetical protein